MTTAVVALLALFVAFLLLAPPASAEAVGLSPIHARESLPSGSSDAHRTGRVTFVVARSLSSHVYDHALPCAGRVTNAPVATSDRVQAVFHAGAGLAVLSSPDRDVRATKADGGMFRREANTGGFSDLQVPMQKRSVTAAAKEGGVGLDGVKVRIVRDPELVGSGFQGYTHPSGKQIDLYPDAFASRETLVKTLGHERTHVYQVRTFGPPKDSSALGAYERAAQATESSWWQCALVGCG